MILVKEQKWPHVSIPSLLKRKGNMIPEHLKSLSLSGKYHESKVL